MRTVGYVGLAAAVFLIAQSILLVRTRHKDVLGFVVWLLIGLAVFVVSIIPSLVNWVMQILGMQQRAFLLFGVALLVILNAVLRLRLAARRHDHEISMLNEEISLLRAEVEEKTASAERNTGV